MSGSATTVKAGRTEQVDYVAEHLLPRAAILVRLLVKKVHSREISRIEMEVLSTLREGPRRITELAELGGVAQPTMTLLVRRLQQKGWVERECVPDDGRVVMVGITEAGVAAQLRFRGQFLQAMRTDLEELSDDQLQALTAATEALISFVDDLQQRAGR